LSTQNEFARAFEPIQQGSGHLASSSSSVSLRFAVRGDYGARRIRFGFFDLIRACRIGGHPYPESNA
jgi:hypothetical protein